MEIKIKIDTNEPLHTKLVGKVVEKTTDWWGDGTGDPKNRAHYRDTWKIVYCIGYNEPHGGYLYTVYNYKTKDYLDIILDETTIHELVYIGKSEVVGGGDVDAGIYWRLYEDETRVVEEPPLRNYLQNRYICREWETYEKKNYQEVYKDHYVDLYYIKDVEYNTELSTYILTASSLGKNRQLELYYLSGELRKIIDDKSVEVRVESYESENHKERRRTTERTYLLPYDVPVDLVGGGVEWYISDAGIEWLTKNEVLRATLVCGGEPQPVPRKGDKSHIDVRREPLPTSFQCGGDPRAKSSNIII